MKPVIVLIGRPNVGKSTLFNRLTAEPVALIADEPGVTRDRLYGTGRLDTREYIVVDTGGMSGALEPLPIGDKTESLQGHIEQQISFALNEADAVIFVADYRTGCTATDTQIGNFLRRTGKPVWTAVNKAEGVNADLAVTEFHALGLGIPHAVSAAHGDGVRALMTNVMAVFPPGVDSPPVSDRPRFAVIGRPNVGKSTLINALVGEKRVIVSGESGTTRDRIEIPLNRKDRQYVVVDTAGVRRRHGKGDAIEKSAVIKTLQAVDMADVAILLMDGSVGVQEQDAALAGYVISQGRALVVAVNKWDLVNGVERKLVKQELTRKLGFADFARPHFISALKGSGIESMLHGVRAAYAAAARDLSTSRLTEALQKAVRAVPPPVVRGRRARLKLAHQGGRHPPLIVVYGSRATSLPTAYRRYLANSLRASFQLMGTPVRIEFRESSDPARKRVRKGGRRAYKRRKRS